MKTSDKAKKKQSQSSKIKNLRIRLNKCDSDYDSLFEEWRDIYRELNQLRTLIPIKFYKITFKIKFNDERVLTHEKIVESYTPNLAIEEAKKDKAYPETFELIDIKLLA